MARGLGSSLLSSLGKVVAFPFEIVGMGARLFSDSIKLAAFVLSGNDRVGIYKKMLGRDVMEMFGAPVSGVIIMSIIFGFAVSFAISHASGSLLTNQDVILLVSIILVQQVAPALSSGMLAARGALPLSIELGTMADKKQTHSLEILGIDTRQLITAPRTIAVTTASLFHSFLSMLMSISAATLYLYVSLDLDLYFLVSGFFEKVSSLPILSVLVHVLISALLVISVGAVNGYSQPKNKNRVSIIGMRTMTQSYLVVLVMQVVVVLPKIDQIPDLILR
ncbi:ABC transporter permease [Marinobacter sp. CHS3-4]|uniref:ABC transporter permease n=1 Tax=Marinobacter sp. CHS3-4 TaxID=3045174 RepID=UPI0024B4E098|nr:ABC transporter permease [Marinobacter sp. CHS3-4]MDI9245383.1 ABC transporter permease [Marinobacter sp. CHS3-4]